MEHKTKAVRKEEVYLTFALCAISGDSLREVLDEVPYADTRWRKFGISEQALDLLRGELAEYEECFESIHAYLCSSWCPEPPCPKPTWMETVCKAALKPVAAKKTVRRK